MKEQGDGEYFIMRSFIVCTLHQFFLRIIESKSVRWMKHVAWVDDIRNAYTLLVRWTWSDETA